MCSLLVTFWRADLAQAADPITAHVILLPIADLDPVSVPRLDIMTRGIIENLFVGLTRYDPVKGEVQPALASSWTTSPDNLTWTFTLRQDVQWVTYNAASQQVQVLRPVVANDFVVAIRRACDPKPPNPDAHSVYIIEGCRKVATANPQFTDDLFVARELGVQALNDQTLEIKLEFTAPYFPVLLTLPEFRAVPSEAIAKDPDWTKAETIITDGPLTLATRDAQGMTLIRNSQWPDKLAGNVERVAVTFNAAPDAISQQISTTDFALLDPAAAQLLRQTHPDLVHSAIGQTVTVLGFSAESPITQKPAFRRALSQAIDREALVKQLLTGVALPMSRFMPPGTIGGPTDPPDNRGFASDLAQAALIEAGYATCKVSGSVGFAVEDQSQTLALAQALTAQWNSVLGCAPSLFNIIKMSASEVQAIAHATVNTNSKDAPPRMQLWLYSWTPDYPDANAWTGDALHCQFGYLKTGLACSTAEIQIDAAFLEKDQAKRIDDYTKAEEIWFGPTGTFPVAPLYVSLNLTAQQAWLKGVAANSPLRFDLWTLSPH